MTEVAYVIARVVYISKSIESRDNSQWKVRLVLNLSSQSGIKVGL